MAKARQLKGRIRSVQNTRKITRTMELVSTSKLKRAQDRVAAARPYAERLQEVIGRLLTPELATRYGKDGVIVVCLSGRGDKDMPTVAKALGVDR